VSIDFAINYLNNDRGRLTSNNLVVTENEFLLAIAHLNTPVLDPGHILLDIHLYIALKAIRSGIGQGNSWKLAINKDDTETRALFSQSLGLTCGASLISKDLGVPWKSIFPINLGNLVNRRSKRPDLRCQGNGFTTLIECKGTTDYGRINKMVEKARIQISKPGVVKGPVTDSYASCTFIPLLSDTRAPSITACDPAMDERDHSKIEDELDTLQKHQYVRAARYAGFHKLADAILIVDNREERMIEAEKEIENSLSIKFENHQFIGRRLIIQQGSELNNGIRSVELIDLKMGMEQEMAYRLLNYHRGMKIDSKVEDSQSTEINGGTLSSGIVLTIDKKMGIDQENCV
jgi:hypothetical protein